MKNLHEKIAELLAKYFNIDQNKAKRIADEIIKLTFKHFRTLRKIKKSK